jgi:hypothetical protein
MSNRRPEKFWSRWAMTLGVVVVSGAAAVTWTQAEENVVRPEAPGSNAELWELALSSMSSCDFSGGGFHV